MRDELDDRMYQHLRHDLNDSLARLFASLAIVFERLTAQLYDAPWSRERQPRCSDSKLTIL